MLFRDVSRRFPGRTGFVIYFLAVLELWRQGHVELRQIHTFGDITIEWSGIEWSGDETDSVMMQIEDYGEGQTRNEPSSESNKESNNG